MGKSERSAVEQKMLRYQVRQGDTVSSIARRHRIGPETLIAANRLTRDATIQVGQMLNIPAEGTTRDDAVRVERR